MTSPVDDNTMGLERRTMQTISFNIYSADQHEHAAVTPIDHNLSVVIDECDYRLYRSAISALLLAGYYLVLVTGV